MRTRAVVRPLSGITKSKRTAKHNNSEEDNGEDCEFTEESGSEDDDVDTDDAAFIASEDDVRDAESCSSKESVEKPTSVVNERSKPQEKKPRGRPPSNKLIAVPSSPIVKPLGHDTYPVNNFSLTIAKLKSDVELHVLEQIHAFLVMYSVKGGVSTEVGHRAHNLHLQSVFTARFPTDKVHKARLSKMIKDLIKPRNGYKVFIKELAPKQTFTAMVGYISKDEGQPHYQIRTHNVSPAELSAGRREHAAMLTSFDDEKKIVNMKNFFNECFKFNKRCLSPCIVPIEYALTYMVQSGNYVLTPDFISVYRKIDLHEAAILWDMIHQPQNATVAGILGVVFDHRRSDKIQHKRYYVEGIDNDGSSEAEEDHVDLQRQQQQVPIDVDGDCADSEAEVTFVLDPKPSIVSPTTPTAASSIASPNPAAMTSLVSKLVQQCRNASVTTNITRHPQYFSNDFVPLPIHSPSRSTGTLICPATLDEMTFNVRQIRSSRVKPAALFTAAAVASSATEPKRYPKERRNNYTIFANNADHDDNQPFEDAM